MPTVMKRSIIFLFVSLFIFTAKTYAATVTIDLAPILKTENNISTVAADNLTLTAKGCTPGANVRFDVLANGNTQMTRFAISNDGVAKTTISLPESPNTPFEAVASCDGKSEDATVMFFTVKASKPSISFTGVSGPPYSTPNTNPNIGLSVSGCQAPNVTVTIKDINSNYAINKSGTASNGQAVVPFGSIAAGVYDVQAVCGGPTSDTLTLQVSGDGLPRMDWDDADKDHTVTEGEKVTVMARFCPANQPVTFIWDKAANGLSANREKLVQADEQGTATLTKTFSPGNNYVWVQCGGKESDNVNIPVVAAPSTAPTLRPTPPLPPCAVALDKDGRCTKVSTAIGNIDTEATGFLQRVFGLLLGLSGGVSMLLIIRSGYELIVSQGNPEVVKAAKERLTSALIGFLFLIFSLVILEVIGIDILHIPGLIR